MQCSFSAFFQNYPAPQLMSLAVAYNHTQRAIKGAGFLLPLLVEKRERFLMFVCFLSKIYSMSLAATSNHTQRTA